MDIYKIAKFSDTFYKLAFKPLSATLKRIDMPLLIESHGDFTAVTGIKMDENNLYPTGMVALDTPNIQMNPGFNPSEFKRIAAINAPNVWTALYLFGAALYLGGKIVPDSSVTKAAQDVIESMYKRNSDNTNLVMPDVLMVQPSTIDKPWMRAAYINPGTGDAQYQEAFRVGEQIKAALPPEHLEMIIDRIQYDWANMYADVEKTKGGEEGILKQEVIPEQQQEKGVEEKSKGFFGSLK